MEYSVEFIKYITFLRNKVEIISLRNGFIAKSGDLQAKGANIETALMLLTIKISKKQKNKNK